MSISLHALRILGSKIQQAFFAQDCLLCAAPSGRHLICAACDGELPRIASACPRCAAEASRAGECGACLVSPPHFDASLAALAYAYPVDALVQALKYGGELALAAWFAQKLDERLGGARGVDLILPLPLHPSRLASRGFNQAVEIAKRLSRLRRVALDARGSKRVRDTAPQTGLPWRERASNMRDAFACERDLSGLRVAVVDDVMTTGATLDEFARTLKASGAAWVENWVVARTPRDV